MNEKTETLHTNPQTNVHLSSWDVLGGCQVKKIYTYVYNK